MGLIDNIIDRWTNTTRCIYCEVEFKPRLASLDHPLFMTKDHIVPLSRKGSKQKSNILHCCRKCNKEREVLHLWNGKFL